MDQLTQAALDGFAGKPFTGYQSSNMHLAHTAGSWLKSNGYTAPIACKISRGYSVKVKAGIPHADGAAGFRYPELLLRFRDDWTPYPVW